MILGILSDSHDNIWKLAEAMPHLQSTDAVIHCGDLCAPFIAKRLGEGLGDIPVHIVWGNNDGDPLSISRVAARYTNLQLHGQLAKFELEGLRIAVNHYPEIASGLAVSGNFDLVCYGHDHTAYEGRHGDCFLLNPGELMGMNGRSTLAIFDCGSGDVRWIEL
jgi:putative phosphoesterase